MINYVLKDTVQTALFVGHGIRWAGGGGGGGGGGGEVDFSPPWGPREGRGSMAHACFYALCCICAEWQRTVSSREDKHTSGGQRFYWKVEALKQVPLFDTRTLLLVTACVSTMYIRERAFMDKIICTFAPSPPLSLKMVPKRSNCA